MESFKHHALTFDEGLKIPSASTMPELILKIHLEDMYPNIVTGG